MSFQDRMTQTVTVQTYGGSGAFGEVYAAAKTIPCWVEDISQLVLAQSGEQVTSSSTVYAPLANAPDFTVGSLVTVWPGTTGQRVARVITASRFDTGLGRQFEHVAAHLT